MAVFTIKFLHSLVDWRLNFHIGRHNKLSFILRSLLTISGFPPLLVNNVDVFLQRFLNKETIGNYIISLHDVFVTHKNFLTNSITFLYLGVAQIWNIESEVSSNMRMIYPRYLGLKAPEISRRSTYTNIVSQQYSTFPPGRSLSFRLFMWFKVYTKEL